MILPNRNLKLPKETDEFLRRLKGRTKVTPNILARMAFFISVEADQKYAGENIELDGSLTLDKTTWLGDTTLATELTLQMLYPNLKEDEYKKAWAYHVTQGVKSFRNAKSAADLVFTNQNI